MTEDRFEELMRDASHSYRRPPEPDFDAMWAEIERRSVGTTTERSDALTTARRRQRPWVRRILPPLGVAATLVIGIGIGRMSMSLETSRATGAASRAPVAVQRVARLDANDMRDTPYQTETSAYLGQTAALLIALPSATHAGRADEQFVRRAGDLLTRTRLLIDSPAANDPQMRELLEDLELVLAQIVRLQADTSDHTELDLINRALEQRDVIPRLQTAVADISVY